ncbi:MAG: nitrate reductase molybdenum cofactor assembly chaperone [Novosphingobium sp.]|jgi:nitrate reductase delta subunit|nr:nitrate reductase molybdenum cofactor assembly chaperone [Novosphingobium sp.]
MKTFKVLSALAAYPGAAMVEAIPAMRQVLEAERLLAAPARRLIEPLLADLAGGDLMDLQERYVFLFDRTRSLSLHLFEHVHGESRDRGQAMVDLKQLYEAAGFALNTSELPDYIPAFLEYLSLRPADEAVSFLGETVHILITLAERLEKRSSPYAGLFRAMVALSKAKPKPEDMAAIVADDGIQPDDLEALDAVWQEEEVTFGPGAAAAACGKDALGAKLRAANRPAEGMTPPAPAGVRTVVTHNRLPIA